MSSLQSMDALAAERLKARWKPDHLATHCGRCSVQFGVFKRKHHCRRCFSIFCDDCSSGKALLPGFGSEAQRVCKICEAILQQAAAAAAAASSTSSSPTNNNKSGAGGNRAGTTGSSPSGGNNNQNSSSSSTASTTTTTTTVMTAGGIPLPSLECYPRERRILIIGSHGVGKGSFISSACGGPLSSQQQRKQQENEPRLPSVTSITGGGGNEGMDLSAFLGSSTSSPSSSSSPTNQQAPYFTTGVSGFGGISNNNNNNSSPTAITSTGSINNNNNNNSAALAERRRNIPFQGQLYQLVLVNTAGSTVSSELFVHPLLTIGSSAFILMYDVTEPKSFEVLPLLHERLLDCGAHDKAMILVGSKADYVSQGGAGRDRSVSKDAAIRLANQWRIPHVDVASTSKESVDHALLELLKEISAKDTY